MKRIWGHAVSLVAFALIGSAVMPACADNDQSIFIHHALAPPTSRQNGVCLYQPDPTAAGLFEGVLDIAVRDNYFAVLLVGNQLIARGDPTTVRSESNRVHVDGAIVRVSDPQGVIADSEFTSYATGFADVQSNNTPGYGVFGVTAIDGPTKDKIAGTVPNLFQTHLFIANIKAFGKTLGGVDLESGEFQLPIRVCNGCLVSFATGDDPAKDGIDCKLSLASAASSGGSTTVLPCSPGQDESTPCQLCSDRPACQKR